MHNVSGPLKVLVVDDDAFSRRLLVDSLRKKEFDVLEAANGAEALEAARQHGPSLVITDWMMPVVDGLELCKRLRDDEGIAYTYIVMLTAQSERQRILDAFAAGADDYITKPFNEEELISRLLAADRIIRLEASHNQHNLQMHKINAQMASMNDRLQRLTLQSERSSREAAELRFAAEQANLAKGEFLANVSHELRTPLTAVLGYAEMMLDDQVADDAEQRHEAVHAIIRNGKRLVEIVDEILDLRTIEAGQFKIEWSVFSPAALVDEVCQALTDRAEAKSINLTAIHGASLPATIRSDRPRVRQVLINLAANALKFTHAGSVTLAVRTDGNEASPHWIAFDVTDTGIGISEAQQQVIFEPFVQGDSSSSRQFGGTGLGLSICRCLAEALGGKLLVRSASGQGSIFTLMLPGQVGVAMLSAERDAENEPKREVVSMSPAGVLSGSVLLVEDDPDNLRLALRILQRAGLDVDVATDGRTALSLIESAPGQAAFDFVLMDVQIPVLNGQSVVRLLRRRGYRGKVVALTASAMPDEIQSHMEAGFDGVLAKPIERRALLDAVSAHLPAPAAIGR